MPGRSRVQAAQDAARKAAFLEAYAVDATVTHAARSTKLRRKTVYDWLRDDPVFAAAFHEAEQEAIDALEREARRRAIEGTVEPVYQGGKEVGAIRKYSDVLLIFLMKGANPAKYRERVDVTHDIRTVIERLTPDPAERDAALAEVQRIMAEARAPENRHP